MSGDDVTARTMLITESGSFVGPSLAVQLGRNGHRLFLHNPSDELLHTLSASGVDHARSQTVDISTRAGAQQLAAECLAEYGAIDSALVRAAHFAHGPFDEVSDAGYRAVLGQLDTVFHCLQSLVTVMKPGSAIAVATSAHAANPTPGHAVYAAIRAAENAMTIAVAREYAGRGITINAVGSNFMKFPEYRGGWREEYEDHGREIPRASLGSMEELSRLYVVLMENQLGHLVGQFISFSGGWN